MAIKVEFSISKKVTIKNIVSNIKAASTFSDSTCNRFTFTMYLRCKAQITAIIIATQNTSVNRVIIV